MFIIVGDTKYLANDKLDLCSSIDDSLKIPDSMYLDTSVLLNHVRNKYPEEYFICIKVHDALFNTSTLKNVWSGTFTADDYIKG